MGTKKERERKKRKEHWREVLVLGGGHWEEAAIFGAPAPESETETDRVDLLQMHQWRIVGVARGWRR